jgi:hypothetical protein
MKLLIVVDQLRRDLIVATKLKEYCEKNKIELIVSNAYNALLKFFIHRPSHVLVGNADTYHSIYISIMNDFSIVASLPTEQGFGMLDNEASELWNRYLFKGHNSEFVPVYEKLNLIFLWGKKESQFVKKHMHPFDVRVKTVGAIRSPCIIKKNQRSIGFLMDSFQDLLPMLISYSDTKYRGFMSPKDYFILLKIMDSNFYSILPLLRDNFPDIKFIFRKRFSGYGENESSEIKKYLDSVIIDYEFDNSNSLEYIANNSSVLIVCESSSASELQALGVPAINVSNVLDTPFVNQNKVLDSISTIHPYNLAWWPKSEKELFSMVDKALSGILQASPKMDKLNYFSSNVLGIGYGDPAENIVRYMHEEGDKLKNKTRKLDNFKYIDHAIKYGMLPFFPLNLYKKMINFDSLISRIFWRIMLSVHILRKRMGAIKRQF